MRSLMFPLFLISLVHCVLCDEMKGGAAPWLPLNDGNKIPPMGLGTFLGFDENGQKAPKDNEVENAVSWALDAGYRMVDTAAAYHDEENVARGIQMSKLSREDVFIVTKLGPYEQRNVVQSLRNSLQRLNTTYVDLYLIHTPVAFLPDFSGFDIVDYVDTWKGMEEAKKLGLAKSIGISNFNASQIQRLLDNCEIKPAALQVEVNLNLAQHRLLELCKTHGILVMAYTPFGSLFHSSGGSAPPPRADDPTLVAIAEKYNKTTPQVVLRYLIQYGVIPIPKSVHKDRIEQNIDVFDFELTPEEMETLSKFNKDYRVVWPTFWQEHPYFPYEKSDTPAPDIFKGGKKQ